MHAKQWGAAPDAHPLPCSPSTAVTTSAVILLCHRPSPAARLVLPPLADATGQWADVTLQKTPACLLVLIVCENYTSSVRGLLETEIRSA